MGQLATQMLGAESSPLAGPRWSHSGRLSPDWLIGTHPFARTPHPGMDPS